MKSVWALVGMIVVSLFVPAAWAGTPTEGFKPIFNGTDLTGWGGNPDLWTVKDGAIVGQTSAQHPLKHNEFLIYQGGEVGDFDITFDYKIDSKWANSGLQYRSWRVPGVEWAVGGYQADIDSYNSFTGMLYGERDRGMLCRRGQVVEIEKGGKPKVVGSLGDAKAITAAIHPVGQWNHYEIIVKGNHGTHLINGVKTAEYTDNDDLAPAPGKPGRRTHGLLAFQLHVNKSAMKIEIRNVMLRNLDPGAQAAAGEEGHPGTPGAKKKIVFVAGGPSHGYGGHDHKTCCYFLAKRLNESGLPVEAVVTYPGYPQDTSIFNGADAVICYADGGPRHPFIGHLKEIQALVDKGVGIGFIHYAVEVPDGPAGDAFLQWVGGYFQTFHSVNPTWTLHDAKLADHVVTRGVHPLDTFDEWYYHMRLLNDSTVTPILTVVPPPDTITKRWNHNGQPEAHAGNPDVYDAVVNKHEPQAVMWVRQRPDGGRGFGFTGGHYRWNWGDPDQRRLVLNAITWIAHVKVPDGGFPLKPVTFEQLDTNNDEPKPKNFNPAPIREELARWNAKLK